MTTMTIGSLTRRIVFITNGSVLSGQIHKTVSVTNDVDCDDSPWDYIFWTQAPKSETLRRVHPTLVVLVTDEPDDEFERSVLDSCRELEVPILPILGRGPVVLLGPFEAPGHTGCVSCMQYRWENSVRRTRLRHAFNSQVGHQRSAKLALSVSSEEVEDVVTLLLEETEGIASLIVHEDSLHNGGVKEAMDGNIRSVGRVGIYHRAHGIRWTTLVPSHECPRCSTLPLDAPETAKFNVLSQPVVNEAALRVRNIHSDHLMDLYVDPDVGFISVLEDITLSEGQVRSSATIQLRSRQDIGYGSAMSTSGARSTAILEAVERNCSITASNRRPVVFGSYDYLRDLAVNPRNFGLHRDVMYQGHSYLEPYHSSKNYSFVWAYSTREQRPILVPEQIAYYGATRDAKRFVNESSSGCALGGCFEEALLHGIFEVLERDGLLNMWYGKLRVPEVNLPDYSPEDVRKLVQFIECRGYTVRLLNISFDMGIPAIMAVAVNHRNLTPKVVCGSSCHLNAFEAVKGALRELAVQVLHMEGITGRRRQEGLAMLEDASKIRAILDHVVATALPEAYSKWEFLLENRDRQVAEPIDKAFSGVSDKFGLHSRDIGTILEHVLKHIHRLGFDVLVVKQTNLEASAGGFHVVKAIIPGMTPITFGYQSERFVGLTRILELPKRLGYTSTTLTLDDLNPHPHPLA
ncbi:hypothetical protein AN477_22870 [Alicyclobacillus ferrooxydans]|uniref:YcaO domain-containing protein n=2 Tax=Alicyclobacillus ferrooxydans TaxID=471514 RepID=A0A0P9EAH3_9BACL|nr:hypothetical protein AN477_22870 [Alicyclobacillus ferrooxydans]